MATEKIVTLDRLSHYKSKYDTQVLTLLASYALKADIEGMVKSLADLGIAVTPAEINYLSGVTSNLQAQINAKGNGTVTGIKMNGTTVGTSGLVDLGTVVTNVVQSLGYTPYDSTNPSGYTSNVGTITGVQTTAGKHTIINTANGKATFNVPTNTSHLTNDSGFKNGTEVQSMINDSIKDITGIDFQIVDSLPTTGVKGTIYLVSNSGTSPNAYDEYIWIAADSKFEKIGTTAVDLSGYVKFTDIVYATDEEINGMFSS